MIICTIFSLIAQFYPIPFPENKFLLTVCGLSFFFFYGILNFVLYFIEGDFIFHGSLNGKELRVKSKMKRYDEFYSLCLDVDGVEVSCIRSSVGNYYSPSGLIDLSSVRSTVEELLSSISKKTK